MILLLIATMPQITHKDNNMTFLLITIMPQIIYRVHFFYFCSTLLSSFDASKESCVGTVESRRTLGICLIYNQISLSGE